MFSLRVHYDVIKWKYFPRYWPFVREIHQSPADSPLKGQRHGILMFSLICALTNGWVNNRDAGDFRRHCAHYDVTVMSTRLIYLFANTYLPYASLDSNSLDWFIVILNSMLVLISEQAIRHILSLALDGWCNDAGYDAWLTIPDQLSVEHRISFTSPQWYHSRYLESPIIVNLTFCSTAYLANDTGILKICITNPLWGEFAVYRKVFLYYGVIVTINVYLIIMRCDIVIPSFFLRQFCSPLQMS